MTVEWRAARAPVGVRLHQQMTQRSDRGSPQVMTDMFKTGPAGLQRGGAAAGVALRWPVISRGAFDCKCRGCSDMQGQRSCDPNLRRSGPHAEG